MADQTRADLFTFESSALPEGVRVAAFRGTEGISQLYRFEIGLLVRDGVEIDLDRAISARGTLTFQLGAVREPQRIHGILGKVELVHAFQGQALYRAVLVPSLWRLTLNRHSRVFTDKGIPDIIAELLNALGLREGADVDFRLRASHAPREHVCQYKESSFDFISRWMEREGLYYFFDHAGDREKLVITDDKAAHEPSRAEAVRYVPLSGGDTMALEALDSLVVAREALPREVELRDFDPLNPALDVRGKAQVASDGGGEIDLFEENFLTPDEGGRLAALRAQELIARREVVHATGRVFGLRPGFKLTVEGHPHERQNRELLAVTLEHEGNQAADAVARRLLRVSQQDEYRLALTAIDARVQHRSERRTPWPRIYGMERAFVDGAEDSEFAQLDEHGRYRVRLAFDELTDGQPFDGQASARVRMMQPHGGEPEGFHFPLRRGTEVLLTFLGGDPDRPVIAGVVPNAHTPSPVDSKNHQMNILITGGLNRFELFDRPGKQFIDLSTPPKNTLIHLGEPHGPFHSHYIVFNTEGNQLINIGGNRDIEVGGPQTEHVHGFVKETFDSGQLITVSGGRGDVVTGGVTENYDTQDTTVAGAVTESFGSQTTEVKGTLAIQTATATWNSGTIQLDTPLLVVNAAVINLNAPAWKTMNPVEEWYTVVKNEAFGAKLEGGIVSVGGTAMKVEFGGIKVENEGIKVGALGAALFKRGAKSETGGAEANTKGAVSVIAGLWTIA